MTNLGVQSGRIVGPVVKLPRINWESFKSLWQPGPSQLLYVPSHWVSLFESKNWLTYWHQRDLEESVFKVQHCIDNMVRWEQAEEGVRVRDCRVNGLYPLIYLPQVLYRPVVLCSWLLNWKQGHVQRVLTWLSDTHSEKVTDTNSYSHAGLLAYGILLNLYWLGGGQKVDNHWGVVSCQAWGIVFSPHLREFSLKRH